MGPLLYIWHMEQQNQLYHQQQRQQAKAKKTNVGVGDIKPVEDKTEVQKQASANTQVVATVLHDIVPTTPHVSGHTTTAAKEVEVSLEASAQPAPIVTSNLDVSTSAPPTLSPQKSEPIAHIPAVEPIPTTALPSFVTPVPSTAIHSVALVSTTTIPPHVAVKAAAATHAITAATHATTALKSSSTSVPASHAGIHIEAHSKSARDANIHRLAALFRVTPPEAEQAVQLFEQMDVDKDGQVTKVEFTTLLAERTKKTASVVQRVSDMYYNSVGLKPQDNLDLDTFVQLFTQNSI